MKTEYSSKNVRCIYDADEQGFESRRLRVQNCTLELIEEARFQVLRVGLRKGNRHDHEVYMRFTAGKNPLGGDVGASAIEIVHPEAWAWVSRLQDFTGVLQFPVPGFRPYQQPGIGLHYHYKAEVWENGFRLVPDWPAPFHDVIRENMALHGLLREIVRGTRLRVATTKQNDEWVAGMFRVWDDHFMGNNDVGVAKIETEALQKLDERIKERLERASRTANFTPVERGAFARLHETWVTPEPSGEWPNG